MYSERVTPYSVVIHHEYALLYVISLHWSCKGIGIQLPLPALASSVLT
ncbi:MAG: hypothetical protein MR860_00780 [Prevotella sp.]|nr:hypothetical protein [Prevotella sp.]